MNIGMPGNHCAVLFCKSSGLLKNQTKEKVSLHKFPKNETLRKKWIRFCRREKRFNPNTSHICSKHFSNDAYEHTDVERSIKGLINMDIKKRLKSTAYPTILQIRVESDKEQVELIHKQSVETNENFIQNASDEEEDGRLNPDVEVVSKKDLNTLKRDYAALMEEHEKLLKKYNDLQEVTKLQDVKKCVVKKKISGNNESSENKT